MNKLSWLYLILAGIVHFNGADRLTVVALFLTSFIFDVGARLEKEIKEAIGGRADV